jgi:hypothetical protein
MTLFGQLLGKAPFDDFKNALETELQTNVSGMVDELATHRSDLESVGGRLTRTAGRFADEQAAIAKRHAAAVLLPSSVTAHARAAAAQASVPSLLLLAAFGYSLQLSGPAAAYLIVTALFAGLAIQMKSSVFGSRLAFGLSTPAFLALLLNVVGVVVAVFRTYGL